MFPHRSFIFKNTYSGNNNWLKLNIKGLSSNKDAYGARLVLYSGDLVLTRAKFSTEGYLSQNSDNIFFGLGENNSIDSLFIYWPSGAKDRLYDLGVNEIISINEGSTSDKPIIYSNKLSLCDGETMFLETGFYEKYLWSNGDTTQKIEISSPGQYYVSVYDQLNNISTSDTIYISNVSPPQFTLNVKNITADHSSSIEVIGLDTLNNYYVSLDNGPFIRNNLFIPNISSGSHQITVRDINGCESSQLFEIINIVKNENNPDFNNKSIARKWIEVLLEAIRNDLARPPIHARNLFHLSSIMYDALVIDKKVNQNIEISPFLLNNTINEESFVFDFPQPNNDQEYIDKVISYSAYNFIRHRFKNSVGIVETYKMIDSLMVSLDYDINYNKLDYLSGDPKSICLLYTSPSPRDRQKSRMPSSA